MKMDLEENITFQTELLEHIRGKGRQRYNYGYIMPCVSQPLSTAVKHKCQEHKVRKEFKQPR
jgi:hypothetical protein